MWCVLAVTAVLAGATGPALAQHYAMDKCPTLNPVQPFVPSKFLGQWHITQQYRVRMEDGMRCKTVTFAENGTVSLDFVARLKPFSVSGQFLVDASAAGIIKADFDYSDVLGSDEEGTVLWYVLGTDYTSYAVLAACRQSALTNKQYLYILSRSLNPDPYDIARMEMDLKKSKFQLDGDVESDNMAYCGSNVDKPGSPHQTLETLVTQHSSGRPVGAVGASNPAEIHINIADSSISLGPDSSTIQLLDQSKPSSGGSINDNRHSTTSINVTRETTTAEPPVLHATTTGSSSTSDYVETNNLYQEFPLNEPADESANEILSHDGLHPSVAAFIERFSSRPNFVEWSEIIEGPTYRKGNTEIASPVDLFISSIKNKPNFLDFAIHQNAELYRNIIQGNKQYQN